MEKTVTNRKLSVDKDEVILNDEIEEAYHEKELYCPLMEVSVILKRLLTFR